jgi:3'-phosphoadenosine 5'-phosphosulfate sulfotransferase (PAPS reductase)/FAD synthetase
MTKLEQSIELIWNALTESARPAAMLSFGKDSMVLSDLIRKANIKPCFPRTHAFPVDVIYHRDPWFPWKHEFADEIIKSWSMEVYDWAPMYTGVKVKPDMIELVARYHFGSGCIDIPKNTMSPVAYPRRDYICGLNDWLLRPKTFLMDYPWDTVFIGHKSSDTDPFEGNVPLKDYEARVDDVRIVFPLRDWSDKELWEYINEHNIPTQATRYGSRDDRWYVNDYTHACTACIDPRELRDTVFCPKLQRDVKNRGREVLQLHAQPPYVGKET